VLELDQPSSVIEITATISKPAISGDTYRVGWNNLVILLASTVYLFSLKRNAMDQGCC